MGKDLVMITDPRYKANLRKGIDRKICRNNCKQWDGKKCKLKYNPAFLRGAK